MIDSSTAGALGPIRALVEALFGPEGGLAPLGALAKTLVDLEGRVPMDISFPAGGLLHAAWSTLTSLGGIAGGAPSWWPLAAVGGALVGFHLVRWALGRLLDLVVVVAIVVATEIAFHMWLDVR